MARLFFESSALVKRYIQETGTAWVDQLLNPTARHLIHVARLTGVEIISAIARRVRTGTLQPAHQAGLVAQFRQEFTKQYLKIEISPALVTEAMSLAETHALRGSDDSTCRRVESPCPEPRNRCPVSVNLSRR